MAKTSQAEALSTFLREGMNAHSLNTSKVSQRLAAATFAEVEALNSRGENTMHILAANPQYCKDEWFTDVLLTQPDKDGLTPLHTAASMCMLKEFPERVLTLSNLSYCSPQTRKALHIVADYECLHHIPDLRPENLVKMPPGRKKEWLAEIGEYPIPEDIRQLLSIEAQLLPAGSWNL